MRQLTERVSAFLRLPAPRLRHTVSHMLMHTQRRTPTTPIASPSTRRGAPSLQSLLLAAALCCGLLMALGAMPARAEPPGDPEAAVNPATLDPPPVLLYLPQIAQIGQANNEDDPNGCPTVSDAQYASVPVIGASADHPPSIHADLNLAVRGYVTFTAALTLVDINGPTDDDAPRLGTLFADRPLPEFTGAYQVNGWDWGSTECPDAPWAGHGCRAAPIVDPPVTLLAMASARGEAVFTPYRRPEIYPTHFVALVLYAEETRLTLGYTCEDSAAVGYVVHLEDVCVDPNLLSLYRSLDATGRALLPALHSMEQVGVAAGPAVKAAVRDTGSFMDPRSRKDWWQPQ